MNVIYSFNAPFKGETLSINLCFACPNVLQGVEIYILKLKISKNQESLIIW
jgi:hypothetical protein